MDNLPDFNDIPRYGALLRDSQSFNANLCSSDNDYDGKNTRYHSSDLRWKRFATNEIYASNDLTPFPESMSDACYRSFLHNVSKDPARVYDSSAGYAYLSEVCLPEGEHTSNGADLLTRHEELLSWKIFSESCKEAVQQSEKSDKELPFTLHRNEELQNMNAGLNKIPNLPVNVQESIQDNHGSVAEPETDIHESCCLSPDYSLKLNSYGNQSYCSSLISCSEENVEDGCIVQCITSPSRDIMTHRSYFNIPDQGVYKKCNAAGKHLNKDESHITVFETPDRNLFRGEFVNYGSMANASLLPDEVDLFVVPGSSDELCLSKSPSSAFSRRISIHMKGLPPNCMSDSPLGPPYSVLSHSHLMQLKPAWNMESSKVHEVKSTEGKCEAHAQCTYAIMCPCSPPAVSYPKQKYTKQNLDLKYHSPISSSEHKFSRCLLENLKHTPYVKSPDKHSNDGSVDSVNEEELDCMFNRQLQTPVRKLMYRSQCLNSVTVANASFDSPAKEDSLSNFSDPGFSTNSVRHSSLSGALPKSISVRLKGLSPKAKTVFSLCSGIATGRGGKKINEQVCEIYEQGTYKTELCNKWESMNSNCPYGQNCRFAHGLEELRVVARHSKYKTQVCRMVSAGEECRYGHRCHFRHALKEEE